MRRAPIIPVYPRQTARSSVGHGRAVVADLFGGAGGGLFVEALPALGFVVGTAPGDIDEALVEDGCRGIVACSTNGSERRFVPLGLSRETARAI
jgi:hypothetical protein